MKKKWGLSKQNFWIFFIINLIRPQFDHMVDGFTATHAISAYHH